MTTIERIDFRGWAHSYRITNGTVEAIVPSEIGPRVMSYGFTGGQNFFKVFDGQAGRSGETEWQLRGGHRLWAAPEDPLLTYAPDNSPVRVTVEGGILTATAPVEQLTGLEKSMTVRMAPEGTAVEVVHRIRNAGTTHVELAPWAPTMMAPGGVGFHGFPPRGSHPKNLGDYSPLILWAYTDLTDRRWHLLRKYLVLEQDPANAVPQKLGTHNPDTWAGYHLNHELFLKRTHAPGPLSAYTDGGCSFETFTNADFLELETLGPLVRLGPGASATHVERWSAHRDVAIDQWTDDELDRVMGEILRAA